jgi:diguanylate cyclase (GGDEF)-like protein
MSPSTILPLARSLSRVQRGMLRGLWAVIGACLVAMAARVLLGLGAGLPETVYTQWLASLGTSGAAVALGWRVIAVPEQRGVWIPLAVGVGAFALGTDLWAFWLERLAEPPFPSLADPLWLSLYPFGFVSAVLVLRVQIGRIAASVWLDGLIGALATSAAAGALILGPLTENAAGNFVAVLTGLAYPVGDLLLVGVLVAGLVITGGRPTVTSCVLAAGFVAFGAGDVIYLESVAAASYVTGLVPNVMWLSGLALLTLASWTRIPALPGPERLGRLAESVPTVLAVVAVGVLIVDHLIGLDAVTVGLAAAALLVALLRLARSAREERQLHQTRRDSLTDELTGLPNRRALNAAATALLAHAPDRKVALLLIDLNDFKEVNDTLGHEAGDQLLQRLGRRMALEVRPGDLLVRLGGDEFAVLIDGYDDPSDAEAAAWRVLASLEAPFPIHDIQLRAGASIGIACSPLHGSTPRELLSCADIAMYRAKLARTGVQLHDGALHGTALDRLALAGELDRALADDEIVPYFQPQIDPRTGRLTGMEALARWEHPTRGTLAPDEFLAAIEQMNLSRRLTLRMLETAATFAARCERAGLDVPVSVNLAAANLMDEALVGDLTDILRIHGLPSDRLRLEITERIVMTDPDRAIALLQRIRALGIGVSLDDFGTHNSSLSYLNRLPVDELKIDRSFIADLTTNTRAHAIVASILALAHTLGLRSTAEGIEERGTLELLSTMNCDAVQGFYIARPMPATDFIDWADSRYPSEPAPSTAA